MRGLPAGLSSRRLVLRLEIPFGGMSRYSPDLWKPDRFLSIVPFSRLTGTSAGSERFPSVRILSYSSCPASFRSYSSCPASFRMD